MRVESFGSSSRGPVQKFVLGAAPGVVLEVLDLGATVHRLWVTGGDGARRNVVLGHATAEEYLDSSDYVGGTIGRFANRIAEGRFRLAGREVQVPTNDRGNHLHGGPEGFHRRLWEVQEATDDVLRLGLVSPHGDQGYPGTVQASVQFTVTAQTVGVELSATTEATTVLGLTSHAYFDLDGTGTVGAQLLGVHAQSYLPVDDVGLPLDLTPVEGTPFDLRTPRPVGEAVAATGGLDHSFALEDSATGAADVRAAATLISPRTATRLEVWTDQPGLQVYAGGGFDGTRRATTGETYGPGAGVALEAQVFPDTPNRPDLGSALLEPGAVYLSRIEWRLGAWPVPGDTTVR